MSIARAGRQAGRQARAVDGTGGFSRSCARGLNLGRYLLSTPPAALVPLLVCEVMNLFLDPYGYLPTLPYLG